MKQIHGAPLALGTLLMMLLVGCPSANNADAKATAQAQAQTKTQANLSSKTQSGAKITWRSCEQYPTWFAKTRSLANFVAMPDPVPSDLQCAILSVPMDYANPNGAQITLALTRLPAKKAGAPMLLSIAGGPGGSSHDEITGMDKDTIARYADFDYIGYAPRGVAPSTPIQCGSQKELQALSTLVSLYPSEQDFSALMKLCQRDSGDFLAHIDTDTAIKDIEQIRLALGQQKGQLRAIGASYGTEVLTRYLVAYPDTLGGALLDSVVDLSKDPQQFRLEQAQSVQQTFMRFFADCFMQKDCPFVPYLANHESSQAIMHDSDVAKRVYQDLVRGVVAQKLSDEKGAIIDHSKISMLVSYTFYSKELWWLARQVLNDLLQGDTQSYEFAMQLLGLDEQGQVGLFAIDCADNAKPLNARNLSANKAYNRALIESAPFLDFDEYDKDQHDLCFVWPHAGTANILHTQDVASIKTPILVASNTLDIATPYHNAQAMAQLLGAPLLSVQEDGHGAVGMGNQCAMNVAMDFYHNPRKLQDMTCPSEK